MTNNLPKGEWEPKTVLCPECGWRVGDTFADQSEVLERHMALYHPELKELKDD